LTVRVQCPNCSSVCQVDDHHLGSAVQCGKCHKTFTLRPSVPGKANAPANPVSEEELLLVLDGPAAAALAAPAAAGSQSKPSPALTPSALPGVCCVDVAAATSPGRARTRNEDSFLVQHVSWCSLDQRHEVALVVVADGMGGHEAGDQASGLVIRTVGTALAGLLGGAILGQRSDASLANLTDAVTGAIKEANRAVYRQAQTQPACRGMGATAAVVLIWDGQAIIGHVGDCRVYRYSGEELTQVTRDQTLVARMVELGQLTPEEAARHPRRNEVAQAIGKYALLEPARYDISLSPGAWLVACCDGLYAHVDERTLQKEIVKAEVSARALADRLIDLANKGGGSDNCTVVVVHCSE